MRATIRTAATTVCAVLVSAVAWAAPVWAGVRQTAAEAFATMQSAAKSSSVEAHEKLVPSSADEPGTDATKSKAWRETLVKEIASAKVAAVREKDDDAVVRFTLPPAADVRELPLHFTGDAWRLTSIRSYAVQGKALDEARGSRPQKLTLKAYTKPDAFEGSAYSFTHVTGVAKECKNRMDAWYCGKSDLHVHTGSGIASLGAIDLAKVDGIPVGATWSNEAPLKTGDTYVLHCAGGGRRDFYVKLRITDKKPDSLTLEWTLLSDGLNAPKSLSKHQPLDSREGDDGAPGLCTK
jgi:rhodanese-related sulfurtransferase